MTHYPARVIVDLDAIRSNVHVLAQAAPSAEVMAVVKADAYGHGLLPVARAALDAGAAWLGVAQLPEALALRRAGIGTPLLAWLYAPGAPFEQAVAAGIDLGISDVWAVREVAAAAQATGTTATVHLKVDTGMGRSGAMPYEWPELLDTALAAQRAGHLEVVGVWSHLARADDVGHVTNRDQVSVFTEAAEFAESAGAPIRLRHLANSAATLTAPTAHFDLVRPGLAMYGLSPIPHLKSSAQLGLVPAMRVEADVALVKNAPAGHGVSYGHTYTTSADTDLALVPLGYADGIPRHASNAARVRLGTRNRRIAGVVCMDQFVIDLGADGAGDHDGSDDGADDHGVIAGEPAVLFGTGADGEPTAQDWAEAVGTINYEIVARMAPRIPRTYLHG